MLAKLSIRNMKRSIRDYGIYILTLTIAFAFIYAYNLISFSPDIMMLSRQMEGFRDMNFVMSVLIIFVIAWLINYILSYMIKNRGREFATYLLLGIKNSAISRMFFIENLLLGMVSLLLGILFGSVLYQVFVLIIFRTFQTNYKPSLGFSLKALEFSVIYEIGMLLLLLLMNSLKFRKMSIYQLMYLRKQNEKQKVSKNGNGNVVKFILFLCIGVIGLVRMHIITRPHSEDFSPINFLICVLCIIISVYGSYISLSPAIVRLFINNARKYKGDRLVLCRELAAKSNTMRFTLGNLAMLIMIAFLAIQTQMIMRGYMHEQYLSKIGLDIMISDQYGGVDYNKITDYIQNHEGIIAEHQYNIYDVGSTEIGGYLTEEIKASKLGTYMKYSDYVKLRTMMGYTEVVDGRNGYIMHSIKWLKNIMMELDDTDMVINGNKYPCMGIYNESFALEGINGLYFIVVVPDEAAANMKINHTVKAFQTVRPTTEATGKALEGLLEVPAGDVFEVLSVKGQLTAANNTGIIIVSFALFYLALIFTCAVATIMSVQFMGDLPKFRYHFRILFNLGMSEQRMDGIILRQIMIYYAIPLLLSIPFAIFFGNSIGSIFYSYVNENMIRSYVISSLAGFGFIYSLYFILTYQVFVKAVRQYKIVSY